MNNIISTLYNGQNRAMNINSSAPNEPMCCFCIPLWLGVIIIAIMILFDTYKLVMFCLQMKELSTVVFFICAGAVVISGLAVLLVLRYFFGRCFYA